MLQIYIVILQEPDVLATIKVFSFLTYFLKLFLAQFHFAQCQIKLDLNISNLIPHNRFYKLTIIKHHSNACPVMFCISFTFR